jgi:hypothetical protein
MTKDHRGQSSDGRPEEVRLIRGFPGSQAKWIRFGMRAVLPSKAGKKRLEMIMIKT